METTVRLFQCAFCQIQVLICTYCDCANIYCKPCALGARKRSTQAAGKRYQKTDSGKRKHAQRQKRYRERQKLLSESVTHHPSQPATAHDSLLSLHEMAVAIIKRGIYCHFCERVVSLFVRNSFLRSHSSKPYGASGAKPQGP